MDARPNDVGDLLIGRYRVHDEIAAGGMATVHLGRLVGDEGFSRTVAIKRLHRYHAKDPEIVKSFTDEARIAARIHHPNVVQTLDVISQNGEVFLVMEYVHGEPLSRLIVTTGKRKEKMPPQIVAAILSSALRGLHAAHEAKDSLGRLLGVVHRDISPQNIMVGIDGVSRVLDFGIARAAGRLAMTADGAIKGKVAYMAPEHLRGHEIDRRADIYAAGVVLWESLTCKRLHSGNTNALTAARSADGNLEPPSSRVPGLPPVFDDIAHRALRIRPEERFATAQEMAEALEKTGMVATTSEIAAWMQGLVDAALGERARLIERIENDERHATKPVARAAPAAQEAMGEKTVALPPPAEKPPHRVESTIKMTSTDLIQGPSSAPPARMPLATVPVAPEHLKASNSYLPAVAPAQLTASNSYLPAVAPPVPKPAGRETLVNIKPPVDGKASGLAIWWPWIVACVVVFIVTAVIVAVMVGG